MKKLNFTYALAMGALLATSGAFAKGKHENGPCKPVLEACKAAGKEKRDAWHCVKEYRKKGAVEGVSFASVTEEQAKTCKEEKMHHRKNGGKDAEHSAEATPATK